MTPRTVEDRLREEYFDLLAEMQRVLHRLQTEVTHTLLQHVLDLGPHERIRVEARVKECESAIGSLRRRQEGRFFNEETPGSYSLTTLRDLAGVRVLVFPKARFLEVNDVLRSKRLDWGSDPVTAGTPEKLSAYKYYGRFPEYPSVCGELQVASMLVGLFWQVEHDSLYKPQDPALRGAAGREEVRASVEKIYEALGKFEDTLDDELGKHGDRDRS